MQCESELADAVSIVLPTLDVDAASLADLRCALCAHLNLPPDGLEARREEIARIAQNILQSSSTPDDKTRVMQDLGPEQAQHRSGVYLATVSNVLATTREAADLRDVARMSRQEVAASFADAFDNPIRSPEKGGRPSNLTAVVRRMVVVQEFHASGLPHFHVAVQLHDRRSFMPAKKTLRLRRKIAVHFSCSHTQFWSALRYCVVPTVKKPEVDALPFPWSPSGEELDLFELAQRPFNADGWKRRREIADMAASAIGKKARFTKLDLTAIIISKNLSSKNALLEYAQTCGCEGMQQFVSQHQRRLTEYLEDAREWGKAGQEAERDRQSGWSLVCEAAARECPCGEQCGYAAAVRRIFEANISTLQESRLAVSLRNILLTGPSKTTRAPLIVGATNTGKTTLVLPFDKLFGQDRVFHKPALGSKFALRNLLRHKRFLLWDDYRPVEYAQGTVQVSTFLSLFTGQPFEVQVSQSFSDGNVDFQWREGCLMTAKAEGLWQPMGCVSAEDIRHMQSRVAVFVVNQPVACLKDIDPCEVCMSKWICAGATQHDASMLVNGMLPVADTEKTEQRGQLLAGLEDLNKIAQLPDDQLRSFSNSLVELGARHVREVIVRDWETLPGFADLLPFPKRRLLTAVSRSTQ